MRPGSMSVTSQVEAEISEKNRTRRSGSLYLVLISCVAALGGLLFGYDTAVISGAIDLLQSHFYLRAAEVGWTASSALAGCVLGTIIAGVAGDRLGRRRILHVSALCFLVSALGAALAPSVAGFILMRVVGGVGIGAASIASPLYISEIAPAKWRGRLVALNQLAIVFGMLVIYLVNYFIRSSGDVQWNETVGWRWMFASGIVPSLLLMGLLFWVPETTRFLLMRGRRSEAEMVAMRISSEALEEISAAPANNGPWREHLSRILWLGIILAILQQVTGINVFLYYAPEIFIHLTHSANVSLLETVLVGFTNMLFTVIAMSIVDKVGRKPLLIGGSLGMGICLCAMGAAAMRSDTGAWLLTFVLGYIACFALSVGPATWVVLSEIFPAHFRVRAMAVATAALWFANFIVSQTFPILDQSQFLIRHFGHGLSFFAYAGFCFLETWFVSRNLPETKNRTLEEISSWWSTNRIN